jgi:hypothetical protein
MTLVFLAMEEKNMVRILYRELSCLGFCSMTLVTGVGSAAKERE